MMQGVVKASGLQVGQGLVGKSLNHVNPVAQERRRQNAN